MTLLFLSWLILSMGTGATAKLLSGDPLDCLAPIILGSTMTVVSSKAAVITVSHRCRVFIFWPPNSLSIDYGVGTVGEYNTVNLSGEAKSLSVSAIQKPPNHLRQHKRGLQKRS